MSRLFLIRHGRTRANEAHLYCGSTDLPLSPEGRQALLALRPRYSGCIPSGCLYITSGMIRTEQTLELLFGPAAHRQDPRLREIDFGSFEMRSYEQLKDDPAYQAWLSGDNTANPTPGGESGQQMAARAWAAFVDARRTGQEMVIVTHGGVIAALMERLFPEPGKNRYQWQPAPGMGYLVEEGGFRPIP